MYNSDIEALGSQAIWLFLLSLFFIIAIMGGLLWFGWFISNKRGSVSPYSKKPLMLGVDLAFSYGRIIEDYMKSLAQPENPPFEIRYSAICRETGRIFPNVVKRGEIVIITWKFLNDRYRGNWVSWGSLSETYRGVIRLCHGSLEGFQTEVSSKQTLPKDIEPEFAFTKPGPLYIDLTTKIVLGWKRVPGTNFEVLIVQKPIYQSIEETL